MIYRPRRRRVMFWLSSSRQSDLFLSRFLVKFKRPNPIFPVYFFGCRLELGRLRLFFGLGRPNQDILPGLENLVNLVAFRPVGLGHFNTEKDSKTPLGFVGTWWHAAARGPLPPRAHQIAHQYREPRVSWTIEKLSSCAACGTHSADMCMSAASTSSECWACNLMRVFMRLRSPRTHMIRDMLLRTLRMRRGLVI